MNTINAQDIKSNKATTFILPMLGYGRNYYEPFIVNCYVGDGQRPELDNHIFILMRFSADVKYGWIERAMDSHPNFKTKYDLDNGTYVMFVFEIPTKFKKDYTLFNDGKYSKFSVALKNETLKLNELGPDSNAAAAFTKGSKLKKYWEEQTGEKIDEEVMSSPKPKYEVFRYESLPGYPMYTFQKEDYTWCIRFNSDPDSTSLVCKIPSYYTNGESIAKEICASLQGKKLDFSI